MTLFGRRVIADIGPRGGSGVRLEGLRIAFDVEMTRSSRLNTAKVQIWNPRSSTVALAQEADAVVRLWAGYDVPHVLFIGEPKKDGVRDRKEGPERILTIEATDGGRDYRSAWISVSYATETSAGEVLAEVAGQMGIPAARQTLPSGLRFPALAIDAPASEVLDRLSAASGATWTVQDGALVVLTDGVDETTAAVYAVDSGLIRAAKKDKGRVEVTALLDPAMRPGRPFIVESREVNGAFIADRVRFHGDSGFAAEFYVTVEGVRRG